MKNTFFAGTMIITLMLFSAPTSHAQVRDQQIKPSDYSGPIIRKHDPSDGANLGNLFNLKMHQSYSVNFASFGGHMVNRNAFTNSMQFFFNKNLTGQVDVSLLHSPFGASSLYESDNTNKLQVAFDAQLDYQISNSLNLHLEVNRQPNAYGYYPGSYGNSFRSRTPLGY